MAQITVDIKEIDVNFQLSGKEARALHSLLALTQLDAPLDGVFEALMSIYTDLPDAGGDWKINTDSVAWIKR